MSGPSKAPSNIKSLRGTTRKDREPENYFDMSALDELPAAPDWLPNGHATKEWERLGPVLIANRLLTHAGLSPFAHMCALHGKVVQLWSAGESPTGHLYSQYIKFCDGFGMTPSAQAKVGSNGSASPKGSKFLNNGNKPRSTMNLKREE